MADFEFRDLGDGRFALSGVLGFETATDILELSRDYFE